MKLTREEILAKLRTILVEQLTCKETEVTEDATFDDLGADSLDQLEIVMAVEEEFALDINDDEAEQITTVAQAIDHIERELA
jgi:acyl carrier protein